MSAEAGGDSTSKSDGRVVEELCGDTWPVILSASGDFIGGSSDLRYVRVSFILSMAPSERTRGLVMSRGGKVLLAASIAAVGVLGAGAGE